jgi:hypothetical protein
MPTPMFAKETAIVESKWFEVRKRAARALKIKVCQG